MVDKADLTQLHPSLWRASQLGSVQGSSISSGYPQLDAQLPDAGWPLGHLIELLIKHQGIGELRFLMPVLRKLAQQDKWVVFAHPPLLPVANTFEQYGFPSHRLVMVRADRPQDKLWSLEKLMKSAAFGALVVWLPEQQHLLDASALRRLQFQATQGGGLSFIFRPIRAQLAPSPAPLRLTLTADSLTSIRIQILKRRGPVQEKAMTLSLPKPGSALPGLFTTEDLETQGLFGLDNRPVTQQYSKESKHALDSGFRSASLEQSGYITSTVRR